MYQLLSSLAMSRANLNRIMADYAFNYNYNLKGKCGGFSHIYSTNETEVWRGPSKPVFGLSIMSYTESKHSTDFMFIVLASIDSPKYYPLSQ